MTKESTKKPVPLIEEEVIFDTADRKKVYTTIGYPKGKPKGMVIFVHGLASTALWPTMLLGSWYLRKKGYAYCRINLYDWRPGARSLMTSDLLQHSRDVDTVAKSLKRRGFTKLFAVGHSFGGLTLLRTENSVFKAISLWDISSFVSNNPEKWFRTDRATGAAYLAGGVELMMSKRYRRGIDTYPNELKLAAKLVAPCQICYAAGKQAMLVESSKRYYEHLQGEKEIVAIPDASHSFTEEGVGKHLFKKTERWFRKFS